MSATRKCATREQHASAIRKRHVRTTGTTRGQTREREIQAECKCNEQSANVKCDLLDAKATCIVRERRAGFECYVLNKKESMKSSCTRTHLRCISCKTFPRPDRRPKTVHRPEDEAETCQSILNMTRNHSRAIYAKTCRPQPRTKTTNDFQEPPGTPNNVTCR
jgi:hypothetical protein